MWIFTEGLGAMELLNAECMGSKLGQLELHAEALRREGVPGASRSRGSLSRGWRPGQSREMGEEVREVVQGLGVMVRTLAIAPGKVRATPGKVRARRFTTEKRGPDTFQQDSLAAAGRAEDQGEAIVMVQAGGDRVWLG